MSAPIRRLALFVLVVLISLPATASASVVTFMDTETLVRLSPVIVRGRVASVVSLEAGDDRGLFTDVTIDVLEAYRAPEDAATIRVRLLGGRVGAREARVFGTPSFYIGEEVLLFARPAKAGWLTVTGLFQGKIAVERDASGQAFALRSEPEDRDRVLVLASPASSPGRVALDDFEERLRRLVSEIPSTETVASDPAGEEAPAAAEEEVFPTPKFTLLLIPFRRFEPDSGAPLVYRYNPSQAPNVPGGARQAFENALAAWNGVMGHALELVDGGDTTAQCYFAFDGVSAITHEDPCGEMPAFDSVSCAGVLAIGGPSEINPFQSTTVNGQLFLRALQGDVVLNDGAGCFWQGPGNYEEVLSHEIGHTIGLGHSCGDDRSPSCDTSPLLDEAQMRAIAHGDGRGADPRRDDVKGVRFIYPPEAFVELVASDLDVAPGENVRLTMDINGRTSADLWFFSVPPGSPATGGKLLSSFPLSYIPDIPIFDVVPTGTEPPGTYLFVAALTVPGGNPNLAADRLSWAYAYFVFSP